MDYKELFKARRIPSLAESLAKRCQNVIAERHEKRREFFWGSVVPDEVPVTKKAQEIEKKKNTRAEMLQKWKAEKMKKLEEAKKKQKPIFKVGVVQRKVTGSPVFSQLRSYDRHNLSNLVRNENHMKSIIEPKEKKGGIITRARAKKMNMKTKQTEEVVTAQGKFNNEFCRIEKSKKQKVNSCVFKVPEAVSKLPSSTLTFCKSPKLMRKNRKSVVAEDQVTKVEKAVSEVQSTEDLPKEPIVEEKIEEKSPVKANENVTPEQDDFRPIHYSPFVTVRSGKKCGRKSKRRLMLDVDEQIKKEEKEMECRIFSFRKYIECETKRLLEKCDEWKHIYEEFQELPTDVEGDIDSVIGKTNLLTSDKFNQFRGLIDKCEFGDPFIKVDDLQGFQDWVAIEVERIDEEFHRLERRKGNNWQQPEESRQPKQQKRPTKTPKKAARKPVGKSNIREYILAARKFLKEENGNGGEPMNPKTPTRKQSLLKEVLSAQVKKKTESSSKKSLPAKERRNSGLEMMVASQKIKFPTPAKLQKSPVASDFEVYFGEEITPNRSILKKTPKTCNSSKGRVTFKRLSQNEEIGGRKLSEKYFRPLTDEDENSPMRTVLSDLGNLAFGGMRTRSRTRQLSQSGS